MIRQRIIAHAHQLLQIRRVMEIKTRPDRKKRFFQAVINGAAISGCEPYVFSTAQWKQLESEAENALAQARLCERGLRLYRQAENSKRHYTQAQTRVPKTRIDHEEANTAMVPIDALAGSPLHLFGNTFGSFDWEKTADFELNGSLTHRALPALRQHADDLTRLLPSWPGFVWGWVPLFLNPRFLGCFRVKCLEGGNSSERGGPSLCRSLFRGRAGIQPASVP